ncbi:MAG: type II CAAX endopeptidase family protein [Bacteroidales bacterium]|nr:type II CAAX endopeptidase family protein [Bacteroidales bacterium]
MKRFELSFTQAKPFVKLMMLICFFMVFASISGFLVLFMKMDPLVAQTISQIIMFGLSIMLWGKMFEGSAYKFIEIKKKNTPYYILLSFLLVFIVTPFIDGIGLWNNSWTFESEQIYRTIEKTSTQIMQGFLMNTTPSGLIINIVVIAFLPAVLEELFFRAAMQKTMISLVKYRFLGILLTSIIFSLLHFQLFSCIPRVFLGLFLGYLYVISQNIIVPIIFHFINNLTVVVGSYLFYSNLIEFDINKLGSVYNPLLFIISILLIGLIFIYEKKKAKKIQIE